MIPLKRRKVVQTVLCDREASKFPDVVIYILERKMGSSRKAFLTRLGRSKGFLVEESYSSDVTHVVAENNSGEEVKAWLQNQTCGGKSSGSVNLLDISWYTESMGKGSPILIEDRHRLKVDLQSNTDSPTFAIESYACQRRTPLKHHNASLTEALELLAQNAEFTDNEGRSVAFRRAAAVLKTLPRAVRRLDDLKGLPCLGEHSLRVIKEILEDGVSSEVESTRQSEQYKAMKVLTGIFGVGTKTAERWFREGIRSLADLKTRGGRLNREQQAGLDYYDDLNRPVSKAEAHAIGQIVGEAVRAVLPGAEITLTGGFRRGKEVGHDVDFLITHPEEGKEEGLMPKIVSWLETKGLLLYQKTTRNSYLESKDGPVRPSHNMDRFERCFSIFKLKRTPEVCGTSNQSAGQNDVTEGSDVRQQEVQSEPSDWRAVRVDLVVSPYSQFAFALLGWTGSKLFERELRRWAGQEKSMSLSSHVLYDRAQNRYLRASSEEEIFALLGLEYIPPSQRNA
ncbi:DNA-directed DNA/RNA polymerase mu [Chanos chanos]|uniref:DNA-directed DNA/RNA polymerase mu n=1 Tax=Chanos chanos TaxID=29144 RepID=A0A6J2UVU8_CHACN|nr:DNA-directed DNA/RNA polymerase mu [Chanos chanos]